MPRRFKVFHSGDTQLLEQVHVVLVRPVQPRNVGSVARAMMNMGITSQLRIVSRSDTRANIINDDSRRLACHAASILENCLLVPTLNDALLNLGDKVVKLAITRRLGSSERPHPSWIHEALPSVLKKVSDQEYSHLALVFGPEDDGLSNDEVKECDWVVGIPSDPIYPSLNLAQAVMVCCYELRRATLKKSTAAIQGLVNQDRKQKARLIDHIIQVSEIAGFVRPGDPHKMRPYLSEILSGLPNHVKDIKTLHGLLDQVARSIQKGAPDVKGRFQERAERENH